jgi:hypothetical protein
MQRLLPNVKQTIVKQDWLLLVHQLPQKPTNLRVRIWRKLQRLGAVVIKNSVYVLPYNEKTHEDFQWLKQEIESSGGDVSVFRAGSVEGATDEQLINTFRKQRDEEYAQLAADIVALTGTVREQKRGGHLTSVRLGNYETESGKLRQELERIISIDFFGASGRRQAEAAYDLCQKALRDVRPSKRGKESKSSKSANVDLSQYQGRRWVTRPNLHIDRLASIWLIKRFIDTRPRFHFVVERETVEGGIPFDMFGAEFTHHGEDCTFETMLKRFGLIGDKALSQIAEIVHDIDLKDNKFNRTEAVGLNAIVRGLASLLKDDHKLAQQCNALFDGLYELFTEKIKESNKENGDGSRTKRRTAKQRRTDK